MERREFITGCSLAIAAMVGSKITGYSFTTEANSNKEVFIYLFLRGGCDGLNLVGPVNDPFYIAERPYDLRITDSGDNQGLSMTNPLAGLDFRFHKKASGLKELYDNKSLAVIHAAGLTNETRSHFDAMDIIERGSLNNKNLQEGWFTRYLNSTTSIDSVSVFPSMAISSNLPASFLGSRSTISLNSINDYRLKGDVRNGEILRSFYGGNSLLDKTAINTLDSIDYISKRVATDPVTKNVCPYYPENNVKYPDTSLGKSLQTLAQVIKMDMGLQIASVDYGGWDTHEHQPVIFSNLTEGLSKALSAFYNDIPNHQSKVTMLVMSEFGRRLKANKSSGTDHGHGNVMLVLGGNVNGGQMYGKWPGLANEQLDNNVDLAVTTDYRNVLSEIIIKRLSNPKLGYIFPEYKTYTPLNFINGSDMKADYNNNH